LLTTISGEKVLFATSFSKEVGRLSDKRPGKLRGRPPGLFSIKQ
jgi:hypothetical protein